MQPSEDNRSSVSKKRKEDGHGWRHNRNDPSQSLITPNQYTMDPVRYYLNVKHRCNLIFKHKRILIIEQRVVVSDIVIQNIIAKNMLALTVFRSLKLYNCL